MRAVVAVVVGVRVVVEEVVARQEARVAPVGRLAEGLARDGVGVVLEGDARVEHGDRHRGRALLDAPGALGVHLLQVPLEAVERVVRREGGRRRSTQTRPLGSAHATPGIAEKRSTASATLTPGLELGQHARAEARAARAVARGRSAAPAPSRARVDAVAEGDDHLALAVRARGDPGVRAGAPPSAAARAPARTGGGKRRRSEHQGRGERSGLRAPGESRDAGSGESTFLASARSSGQETATPAEQARGAERGRRGVGRRRVVDERRHDEREGVQARVGEHATATATPRAGAGSRRPGRARM